MESHLFTKGSDVNLDNRLPQYRPYIGHLLGTLTTSGFKNLRILDLGCGPQFGDLRIFDELGASLCVGIDIAKAMSTQCGAGHIHLVKSDVDDFFIPISDNSFDLVLMHNVFEHLHNPLRALEESRRVLTSGGFLSLITENHAALKNRVKLALGGSVHFPLWRFTSPDDHVLKGGRLVFTGHVREYTTYELRYIVPRAGLEIESMMLHPAASKSGRDFSKDSGGKADSITRISESSLLFFMYHVVELAVPSWRYMISVMARKK